MDNDEKEKLLTETKTILNSLVIPNPRGVSLRTLCKDYEANEGKEIPYKELGFSTLTGFLRSMPESINVTHTEDQTTLLFPVCNESNEHMIELVGQQSKKKLKKPFKVKLFPKRTSTPMDPRIAKRQRPNGSTNNESNGSSDNSFVNLMPNGIDKNGFLTKPDSQMTKEEEALSSLVDNVRKETPKLTTTIQVVEMNGQKNVLKNGVDSKIWSDIFDVTQEAEMKKLPIDSVGMRVQKAILREPLKIGEYSLKIASRGNGRLFFNDASELKYLHEPLPIADISYDLTHGYDMVSDIHWGKPSNAKLDELLRWISSNRKKFMVAGEFVPQALHTDFVCYRGTLTRIMSTPYENQDRWVIGATKFKGTIYLCQFHEEFPPPDDYYNKMSFGGFRFEQYLTSYEPTIPADPNDFDPDHHEYCVVMRSRLGTEPTCGHSLVFGAELDAVMPNVMEQPGRLKNFVELKTTKLITNENQYRSFCKYKLLKWWIQSYLVGVPTILCGYKDNKSIVKKLEKMAIDSFPALAQEFWSANVCLNFMNRTLDHIKEVMTIDDPNVVYLFSFSPDNEIRCKRLTNPGHFQILPHWYITEFR